MNTKLKLVIAALFLMTLALSLSRCGGDSSSTTGYAGAASAVKF